MGILSVVPFLFLVLWVGLLVYLVLLATRLVNSVEQIARVVTERLPNRLRE